MLGSLEQCRGVALGFQRAHELGLAAQRRELLLSSHAATDDGFELFEGGAHFGELTDQTLMLAAHCIELAEEIGRATFVAKIHRTEIGAAFGQGGAQRKFFDPPELSHDVSKYR